MRNLKSIVAAALLLAVSVPAFSQAKIYTRRVLLEDFPNKVCKVVISSQSIVELAFGEEVSGRWKASPYEFCTPEFYQQNSQNNDYYFLRLVTGDGIVFMELSKGGNRDDADRSKRPVDIARIPVASLDNPSGRELIYLGGFVDIIQKFALSAMDSDITGYGGLGSRNLDDLEGYTIYTDPDKCDSVYINSVPGSLVYLCIFPKEPNGKSNCYKMLLSSDTHEMLMFEKEKYVSPFDAYLSKKQAKLQLKRGGKFAE